MIETILLAGRVLMIALLFLFLFAVMRTGVGLVKGVGKSLGHWTVKVTAGPREVNGLKMAVTAPLVVGRAPGADITVDAGYVSGRHARIMPLQGKLVVEDLGSTNGTKVNGQPALSPCELADGDLIQIGDVVLEVHQL